MNNTQNRSGIPEEEIDLSDLVAAIWRGKWVVCAATFICIVAAYFYAIALPDIYKSEVTLAPVSEKSGLQIPGQLGGLVALAGVNLGKSGGGDKTGLAIEILKSRDFLGRFIEKNDLYLPIMAVEKWDRAGDKLVYNPELYNNQSKQWVRTVEAPFLPKPSTLETIEQLKSMFKVYQDETSGIIKLSVEYYSPIIAKEWAEALVKAINEEMRTRELSEAERSIEYLNMKISETNIADVRVLLFSLIEEQTKTAMLANVRDEYIFKTIDPAIVSEKKDKPQRALIVVLSSIIGIFLGIILVLLRYYLTKK